MENPNEDDYETLKQRGSVYMKDKKYMKAIDVYTLALQKQIDNPIILSNRAEAFLKQGYNSSALDDCNTFLSFDQNKIDKTLQEKTLYRKARALAQLATTLEQLIEVKILLNSLNAKIPLDIIEEKEKNLKGIFNIKDLLSLEKDNLKLMKVKGYFLDSLPKENKYANYTNSKLYLDYSNIKGVTWRTKTRITRGELLIAEYPIVSVMNEELIKFHSTFSKFEEMGLQSSEISIEVLFTFLKDRLQFEAEFNHCIPLISSLCSNKDNSKLPIDQRKKEFKYNDDTLKEIISNNAILTLRSIDTQISPLELCYALYINCSFLNHSCKSNAFYFGISNMLFVKAIEDIEANEDITISYIEPKHLFQRKNELLKWDFECQCKHCNDEKDICDRNAYMSIYETYVNIQNLMTKNDIDSYRNLEDKLSVYLQDSIITYMDKLFTTNSIDFKEDKLKMTNFILFKAVAVILGHIDKHKPYSNYLFEKAYDCIKEISIRERYEVLVQWRLLCKSILFRLKLYEIEQQINGDYDILYKL